MSIRRAKSAFAAISVLSIGMAGCGGSEGSSETASNGSGQGSADASEQLEPLSDGFPSEPITLYAVDVRGSADHIFAQQLAEAAGEISPVRIDAQVREDFTAYGTWEALNWVQEQEGGNEGYHNLVHSTPGDVLDLSLVPISEETGLTLEDRNSVIATEQVPYVIVQRSDAPWGSTMDEMVDYAKENPGELRYISRGPASALDVAMEYYMAQLDIEAEKIVGGNQTQIGTIIGSGEGDIALMTPEYILPQWENERIEPLMFSGDTAPEPWSDTATAADMGMEQDFWGATRGIIVTGETPDAHREWLFELWKRATESDAFRESRGNIPGLSMEILNHEEMTELSQNAAEETEEIVRELGVHWEQQ